MKPKYLSVMLITLIVILVAYLTYEYFDRFEIVTGEEVPLGTREFRPVGSLYGPEDRSFVRPLAVAAANGRVFVADSGNRRIVIYSSSGRFIRSLGDTGDSSSKLVFPTDIVINAQGHILVADRQAGRVMIYNQNGDVVKSLPEGKDRLKLEGFSPLSLAVDADNGITVFDVYHQRLVLFDGKGRFLRAFNRDSAGRNMALSFANGIVVPVSSGTPVNKIYVANSNGGTVLETDSQGKSFEILPRLPEPKAFMPRGMALDPADRELFIIDTLQHMVFRYDLQSKKITGTIGIKKAWSQSFSYPNDISIDRDGRIYVADSGNNRIVIIEPAGK